MKASLQNKIRPPEPVVQNQPRTPSPTGKVYNSENKVDFKSVLINSMEDIEKERANKGNLNSLEGAENYEQFIETLNERTQQEQRTPKNNLDKDDFLKLFVTQLQHQDPLKPKDGTEMAAQLAQFNSLEQMLNVSKGIERLEKIENAKSANDMIQFIGKKVTVDQPDVILKSGKPNPISLRLESSVQSAQLTIKNALGESIAEIPLGDLHSGNHHIDWDGKDSTGKGLPDGKYSFELKRFGSNEQVPAIFQSHIEISGIDITSGGALHSDLGKIKPEDIQMVALKDSLQTDGKAIKIEKSNLSSPDNSRSSKSSVESGMYPQKASGG